MSFPDIQEQVKSATTKIEYLSPLLSEYFEHSFKRLDAKVKPQNAETNESRPAAESADRHNSRDARTSDQQPKESSSSRQSGPEAKHTQSREQQDGQLKPKTNESSQNDQEQHRPNTQNDTDTTNSIGTMDTGKSNGSGGKLSDLIREAVKGAIQARPLHIYPEAKPSDKAPSTKPSDKNPITGFDQPEIAPGIKLGITFEY